MRGSLYIVCFHNNMQSELMIFIDYLSFNVTFNTVQIISGQVVLKGRGNQYIELVKILYYKLLAIGKKLPLFPHRVRGLNHQPLR